jgi:hypothetical protein
MFRGLAVILHLRRTGQTREMIMNHNGFSEAALGRPSWLWSAGVALACFLGATSSEAASCKYVDFYVSNQTLVNGKSKQVIIKKIEYWDSEAEKTRTELMFDAFIRDNSPSEKFITQNLSYVHGQTVKVRYVYAFDADGTTYNSDWSAGQTCNDHNIFRITLKGSFTR